MRCPFCAATLRSSGAPAWLAFGLALGLGTVSIGCVDDKGDDTETTVTASQPSQGNSETNDNSQTIPDSYPDGVTYAGPDESWTTEGSTTSTSVPPNTTVPDESETVPDGSTYAGPDENWTTEGSTTEVEGSTTEVDGNTSEASGSTTDAGSSEAGSEGSGTGSDDGGDWEDSET